MGTRLPYAAAVLALGIGLSAADELTRLPPPPDNPAFAIVTREPAGEIRFHALGVPSARQNPAADEVMLNFAAPPDPRLFEQLPQALPEWVQSARVTGNAAIIHARMPANFELRSEADGFTLRLSPRMPVALDMLQDAPGPLPPERPRSEHSTQTLRHAGLDLGLRGTLADPAHTAGFSIALDGEGRHTNDQTVLTSTVRMQLPLRGGIGLIAEGTAVRATANNVLALDGTPQSVNTYTGGGALGLSYHAPDGDAASASIVYSRAGLGGRAAYLHSEAGSETELSASYRAPYMLTAEAVADRASIDRLQLRHAQRIAEGLWGEAALRITRYDVDAGGEDIAKSAGFSASLRYMRDFFGVTAGVAYDVEGEYTFDKKPLLAGTFMPMDIHDREIHALSLSMSAPLAEDLWLDTYGGWAIDRYGADGMFGGAGVRFTPAPGLGISAGITHASIPLHQGESGQTTTANIKLDYTMDAAGALD